MLGVASEAQLGDVLRSWREVQLGQPFAFIYHLPGSNWANGHFVAVRLMSGTVAQLSV